MRRHHELPFGAEPTADGVRFRLWASSASAVSLRIEDAAARTIPMVHEQDGWFSLTTAAARPGTRYRYVVGEKAVPDPASPRQPAGVHGPNAVVDPAEHVCSDLGWRGRRWEEIAFYELHIGAFSETGDFAGAIRHLDHIQELGATAVELMPIAEFPGGRNWRYDGVFLYAPASRYGAPEELSGLSRPAMPAGSPSSSMSSTTTSVLKVTTSARSHPSSLPSGTYSGGAALDFSSRHGRPVRDFFIHNSLYWLEEFHFDGLRLDAVHAIIDETLPDIIDEIAQSVRRRITGREVHLVLENDHNETHRLARPHDQVERYTAQWNDDLHHVLHLLVTGEDWSYYGNYAAQPAEHLGRALAEGFAFQGAPSPFRGDKTRGEPSAYLPATAFVAFLQNHDQVGNRPFGTRLSADATEPALHAAIAVVLLSPQILLLFMGEEWASLRPFAFFCDFEPSLAASVRAGRRREFAHFPEFGDEAARERLPDPTAFATFAQSRLYWAELSRGDHLRWLARYGRLLAIRTREIVPRLADIPPFAGDYRVFGAKAVLVEWQPGDRSQLVLVANFADERVPIPPMSDGRLLYYSAEPEALPGSPLSATFFLLAPAPQ